MLGGFLADTTTKAIMTAGLWWPTLFQDADEFVKCCDMIANKQKFLFAKITCH